VRQIPSAYLQFWPKTRKRDAEQHIHVALGVVEEGELCDEIRLKRGVVAGGLQLEAAILGARIAGTPAITRRNPEAERHRGGPRVGQMHIAGGALKF
jgi:hypothetical protein